MLKTKEDKTLKKKGFFSSLKRSILSGVASIGKGMESIGEGMSTFSISPTSSPEDYLKDSQRYLKKVDEFNKKHGIKDDFNFTPGIQPYNHNYFK